MKQSKAELKASLIAKYSEALDKLLDANEAIEDFSELEEAVSQLAERTLPETLSTLLSSKDFSPSGSKLSAKPTK